MSGMFGELANVKEVQTKNKNNVTQTACLLRDADDETTTTALKRTFDFCDKFSKIVGWNFNYDWKSNLRHCLTCSMGAFLWSQCFYSQINFFVNGEYRRFFEVFALYGVGVSYTHKIWIFVRYHKKLTALRNFSLHITLKAGKHSSEKLKLQQLQNLKLCKLLAVLIFVADLVFLYYPMSQLAYKRKLVPLLPIEIIFLDQTRMSGFLTATLLEAAAGVLCMFMFLTIALNFLTAISNCSTQVDLIEYDLKQLYAIWSVQKTTTLVERHMFLRNICQKCQDRDNFMNELKTIFDGPIFCLICVAYMAQIVCLYEIQIENWVPGYGIASAAFFEMLLYCLIGTKACKINERLCYVVTQSKWYTYDIHTQKIFLNLLNSCMNSNELWIGPLAPLSVLTGIEMVKGIYSYYTFLSEAV